MRAARIVVCTAAVGAGHTRAAQAIRSALRQARPDARVDILEVLDFAPRWFKLGYRDGYLATIARVPALAGWLYRHTDHPPSEEPSLAAWFERRAMEPMLAQETFRQADVIVTTHFLCARVLGGMRKTGELRPPLVVCVTDQHPHGVWLAPGLDRLLVASEDARQTAIRHGFAPARVVDVGIPVESCFGESDHAKSRQALGLPTDRPVILVAGGGLGLGGVDQVVIEAMRSGKDVHVVAVCGKNASMHAKLKALEKPAGGAGTGPSCEILGFTMRMHELMAAADIFVGKPGGLTSAEACASGLPMVLLKPLPGQEEYNAARLVGHGAAILEPEPRRAAQVAIALAIDQSRLALSRSRAQQLGRPRAGAMIAEVVLDLLPDAEAVAAMPRAQVARQTLAV